MDTKPVMEIVKTSATLGSTSTTYNEAGMTYNEVGQIYGGVDRQQDPAPVFSSIKNEKPILK